MQGWLCLHCYCIGAQDACRPNWRDNMYGLASVQVPHDLYCSAEDAAWKSWYGNPAFEVGSACLWTSTGANWLLDLLWLLPFSFRFCLVINISPYSAQLCMYLAYEGNLQQIVCCCCTHSKCILMYILHLPHTIDLSIPVCTLVLLSTTAISTWSLVRCRTWEQSSPVWFDSSTHSCSATPSPWHDLVH